MAVGADVNNVTRVFAMDVGRQKIAAPAASIAGTGPAQTGIRTRPGGRGYWSVSDDQQQLLHVTQDPVTGDPTNTFVNDLLLTDLSSFDVAGGTVSLASSPYLPGYPFIGVATGFNPTVGSSTRLSDNQQALLLDFTSGDASAAFLMALPLSGKQLLVPPPLP